LSQGRITGEIDLDFKGFSIEDAYGRLEMEPIYVGLTDRDPKDGEMALGLGLNGAAFIKKHGLLTSKMSVEGIFRSSFVPKLKKDGKVPARR
jgi:hypothetical protein